jgi:3-phosphoshikimate 1-carboxyvinyltransferase
MGASVTETLTAQHPEPVGDVEARGSALRGVTIREDEVASLIDELPMLAVLACYADGPTEVRGAEELRVKETDRIEAVAQNLHRMGARIETFPDGFRIEGPQPLRGARLDSFGDHRIAMAFAIGALGAEGPTDIANAESVGISYPIFFETLRRLSRRE